MSSDRLLVPKPAFAAMIARLPIPPANAGVRVVERDGLGIASVLARRGQASAVAARVREIYGIALPQRPRRAAADDVAFVGCGPGAWLAVREGGGNGFSRELATALSGLASVSDQADGYAVLRLDGRHIRATLSKGLGIDLHPRAFEPDDALVSSIEHIGVTLWQLNAAPTYEIALFRSYADSFWHWLCEVAAEFGLAAGSEQ